MDSLAVIFGLIGIFLLPCSLSPFTLNLLFALNSFTLSVIDVVVVVVKDPSE